ncbi:MAG: DUF433 domain-containing protein [Chloroflexota bacterium]
MAISFHYLAQNAKGTVIAGRRIRVYDVLGYMHEGNAPEYIAENYNVPLAAVYEALAYAEEHPEEMTAISTREDTAYERILATVPPELRAQMEAADAR